MNFHSIFLVLILLFGINVVGAQQSSIKYYQADIPLKVLSRHSMIECYNNKINIYDSPLVDYIGSIDVYKGTFKIDKKIVIAHIDTVLSFSANYPICTFAEINCEEENLDIEKFNSDEIIMNREFVTASKFINGKMVPITEIISVVYTAVELRNNHVHYFRDKNWRKEVHESNFKICD